VRVVAANLEYRYPRGDHSVLAGASFEVPFGTSAAIVGPSGSGKTTLLSLIGGLLPLQSGHIAAVDGSGEEHRVSDIASWVLQTVSLLGDRTAAANVEVGAFSDGATREQAAARAGRYLAAVGLAEHSERIARTLSGGEAQRVAIARALASERPVIIADEPTGQLDAATSAAVIEALIGTHAERTVIVVTHDLDVAASCDLVFELRDGAIHERSTR
jgi:ABC-type lipoprotein export system ATPase subunit